MSPTLNDRLPPQNTAAERGVLGAMLRDPSSVDDLLAVVGADDFYFDAHRKLFLAIADLAAAGRPADLVVLHDELQRRRQLDDVGGVAYLAELWDSVPTAANATYHAGIVRECSTRRAAIRHAAEAIRDWYDGVAPADEVLAGLEARLFELGAKRGGKDYFHVSEVIPDILNQLDKETPAGTPIGFHQLDTMIGGFQEGLYVVGARPSVGKSAFMLSCALSAVRAGVPTLIFSLEMSRQSLVKRHTSMLSGVNLRRLCGGFRLNRSEIEAIVPAAEMLAKAPLYINDTAGLKATEIMATGPGRPRAPLAGPQT